MRPDVLPGVLSQFFGKIRGSQELLQGAGQGRRVPGRDQETVFAIRHHFREAPTRLTITGNPAAMASKRARDTPSL